MIFPCNQIVVTNATPMFKVCQTESQVTTSQPADEGLYGYLWLSWEDNIKPTRSESVLK